MISPQTTIEIAGGQVMAVSAHIMPTASSTGTSREQLKNASRIDMA